MPFTDDAPQSFSDSDLKKLKFDLGYITGNLSISQDDLESLLGRLEAAEDALQLYQESEGSVIMGTDILQKWRKASGR